MSQLVAELKSSRELLRGRAQPVIEGAVQRAVGMVIEGSLPGAAIGEVVEIGREGRIRAEVVGLQPDRALMIPLGASAGLKVGEPIRRIEGMGMVRVGPALLGRVIDGLGQPLDGKALSYVGEARPLLSEPLNPFERQPVDTPFSTGIRSVDALLTLGTGMRMGVFAAAGVGKSTFTAAALKNAKCDVAVVALIGERGREVGEFMHQALGPEGMKKSVLVVATSDRSPLERVRAAFYATAIAEGFRDQGKNVLLVMDSLTRLAMAQREIGLAIGEPPTAKGYTPSVFAMMPKLVERVASRRGAGTMTALYTVLVEGDDINDPVADSARSLIDGHIVLSRDLAARGHYPAIDVLQSLSRVMTGVVSKEHAAAAAKFRECMALAKEAQELISFGAYQPGRNPKLDAALERLPEIERFLKQRPDEATPFASTLQELQKLAVSFARTK